MCVYSVCMCWILHNAVQFILFLVLAQNKRIQTDIHLKVEAKQRGVSSEGLLILLWTYSINSPH